MASKEEILKEMRLEKRLSQKEVAEKLEIPQHEYSEIERGVNLDSDVDVDEALKQVNMMRSTRSRTESSPERVSRKSD